MKPLKNLEIEENKTHNEVASKIAAEQVVASAMASMENQNMNQDLVKFDDVEPEYPSFDKPEAEPAKDAGIATKTVKFEDLEEHFYQILQRLDLNIDNTRPIVLGVTSAVRGEGRTTLAMGLASAIAKQLPVKVVLLEADLEHPSLASELQLPNVGLSDYLRGEIDFLKQFQPTSQPDFHLILAGDCQGEALKILRSEYFEKLVSMLRYRYAVVIVDLPPLSRIAEATRIISQTDLVLMTVAAGKTPQKQVKAALELFPEEKLIGVVLNRTRPAFGLFARLKRIFKK